MVFTFTNSTGSSTSNILVNAIKESFPTKHSLIRIPGADVDSIQWFGRSNKNYSIGGLVQTFAEMLYIQNLSDTTGSILFVSNSMESSPLTVISMNVLFKDVQWKESGKTPFVKAFSIEAIEMR